MKISAFAVAVLIILLSFTLTAAQDDTPTPESVIQAQGFRLESGHFAGSQINVVPTIERIYTDPPETPGYWGTYGVETGGQVDNFVMHLNFSYSSPGDGCEIWFRSTNNDSNQYKLGFYGSGWSLRDYNDSEVTQNNWRSSSNIKTGVGEINNLLLIAQGNNFYLYLNDLQNPISILTDASHLEGDIKLAAYNDQPDIPTCTFSDVWVWEIDNPTLLPPHPRAVTLLNNLGQSTNNWQLVEIMDEVQTLQQVHTGDAGQALQSLSKNYGDVILHTSLTWGDADDQCYIYFRSGHWGDYAIGVVASGDIYFRGYSSQLSQTFSNTAVNSPNIHAVDATIDITMVSQGTTFTLYINDLQTPAAVFSDNTFNQQGIVSGAILLGDWSPSGVNTDGVPTCGYTDVWVWEPATNP